MRVLTRADSSVTQLADLKGKIVAVGDLAGPDKNFFSIQLAKLGIDPNRDVDWRAYPGNLLNVAVEKGEVQAFLASDPLAYLWLKDSAYKEVASNRDGAYRDMTCCILGLRGSLVRQEPQVARAITQALLDAAMFTSQNPDKAAKSFQPYAPKTATLADLEGMVRYHTHHHQSHRGRAQARTQGLCRRFEDGFRFQAKHGYRQIRGADLCRHIRCLTGSRPAGQGRDRGLRTFTTGCGFPVRASRPLSPGPRLACHAYVGRHLATGREPNRWASRRLSSLHWPCSERWAPTSWARPGRACASGRRGSWCSGCS